MVVKCFGFKNVKKDIHNKWHNVDQKYPNGKSANNNITV